MHLYASVIHIQRFPSSSSTKQVDMPIKALARFFKVGKARNGQLFEFSHQNNKINWSVFKIIWILAPKLFQKLFQFSRQNNDRRSDWGRGLERPQEGALKYVEVIILQTTGKNHEFCYFWPRMASEVPLNRGRWATFNSASKNDFMIFMIFWHLK